MLIALRAHKIADWKIVGFFHDLVMDSITKDPTFKQGLRKILTRAGIEEVIRNNTWISRGYFPGTGTFFKVVVVEQDSYSNNGYKYFVKITMPSRQSKLRHHNANITVAKIKEMVSEATLLGDTAEPPLKLKKQRCMRPKGAKLHRIKKRGL
jgi:hypothetical protein